VGLVLGKTMTRMMYIEQKSDGNQYLHHRGPAIIGEVRFSKSKKTIYYNNKTFSRIPKGGIYGNYYCEEDGNEYWISGVKKEGNNRHWAGTGKIISNGKI
jgi:hypothetical protein